MNWFPVDSDPAVKLRTQLEPFKVRILAFFSKPKLGSNAFLNVGPLTT